MQYYVSSDAPQQYNLVAIGLTSLRLEYLSRFSQIAQEHHLDMMHFECLYDWIITEALSRCLHVMCGARVSHHYSHDVYRCVYYDLGPIAERSVQQQIQFHQLHFTSNDIIKVMVTAGSAILAKGS